MTTLANDPAVKKLSVRIGNLEVRSYTEELQGWTLQVDRRFRTTRQDWETITAVAEHLLAASRGF